MSSVTLSSCSSKETTTSNVDATENVTTENVSSENVGSENVESDSTSVSE